MQFQMSVDVRSILKLCNNPVPLISCLALGQNNKSGGKIHGRVLNKLQAPREKKGLAETERDRNFRPPPLAVPFTSGKNATLRSFFCPFLLYPSLLRMSRARECES